MKASILLVTTAAGLCLCGCGGGEKTNSASSTNAAAGESSPLSAPADYLGSLGKGQKSAVKTVDVAALNQAIQLFNVDQGRNPKDLNELVQKNYISQVPAAPYGMKLQYDSTAGTVQVVKE